VKGVEESSGDGCFSPWRPVGEHGWGAFLPGTLRERCRRKFWRRMSLSMAARWGTWMGGFFTGDFEEKV